MSVRAALAKLTPTRARGPFPSLAWAWPTGGRDLLLRAAILPDLERAAAAYDEWQRSVDFDSVDMATQRLLVAISYRMPGQVLPAVDRARLKGVERKLWSHCIVALKAAEPALAALEQAGIEMMVFKGAVRTVLDISNLRGRYASELDLLVRPAAFDRAWDVVRQAGWKVPEGRGDDHSGMIGVNLKRGLMDELDLHKYAYHQLIASDVRPDGLWSRAVQRDFLGHRVFIPSPTDRLLMATAHGMIGGHEQSDWLVDCALLIQGGEVDWALFVELAAERRVAAHAAIALSYLAGPLEMPMPSGALDALVGASRRHPFQRAGALLQGRPRYEHSAFTALGRGLARGLRVLSRDQKLRRLEARRARLGAD